MNAKKAGPTGSGPGQAKKQTQDETANDVPWQCFGSLSVPGAGRVLPRYPSPAGPRPPMSSDSMVKSAGDTVRLRSAWAHVSHADMMVPNMDELTLTMDGPRPLTASQIAEVLKTVEFKKPRVLFHIWLRCVPLVGFPG